MKKNLSFIFLACAALLTIGTSVGAQTNQHYTITFVPSPSAYTGPTNITIDVGTYFFYMNTNATQPVAQWALFGASPASVPVVGSSNYTAITSFGNSIAMNPPVFVTVTISNSGGVSFFYNLAGYLGPMPGGRLSGLTSP